MKTTPGRRFALLKLLLPLVTIVAVTLFLTWRPGPGTEHRAAADVPHTGLDFSIGVDIDSAPDTNQANDDCDTRPETTTPTAKCNIPAGTTFTPKVYLNNRGGVSYFGIDLFVTYAGVTSKNNPDNADWPNCVFPASIIGTGFVRWGCGTGVGAPASTYTGAVGKTSFNCPPSVVTSGTVTLVHGVSDTGLDGEHAEGAGTTEALTINCTLPPTATQTRTPTTTAIAIGTATQTRTPTNTAIAIGTATQTRTPTNTAIAIGTATPTPLPSERADVNVTKTDLEDPVAAGSPLTYRLVIRNKGAETATGVAVKDFLPVSVVFDSYSSSGATCVHISGSVQCVLTGDGNLAPGAQVTIDIVVITPSPNDDIRIGNVAQVSATNEPFANTSNNQDAEQTVVLAPRADLILEKTDKQDPVDSGGAIIYNLRVENIGQANAGNVVVRDNLPPGVVFDGGASSPLCNELVPPGMDPEAVLSEVDAECNLGTVAPGAPVIFQIVVAAPSIKLDAVIKNIAYVTSDNELFAQTGNNLGLAETGVLAPPPDLSIDKAGPPSVLRAGYFSYTLTIRNDGRGHAFNVQITDTLPKKQFLKADRLLFLPITFISSKGATCSNPVGTNLVQCKISKIQGNGGQLVITLNVRAPTVIQQTLLTNQVTVSDPDEPEDPPGNNSDSVQTKIIECYDTTGDEKVRIEDISAVLDHYGFGVGEPGYDILYDIDGNSRILVRDINLVILNYGHDCN